MLLSEPLNLDYVLIIGGIDHGFIPHRTEVNHQI